MHSTTAANESNGPSTSSAGATMSSISEIDKLRAEYEARLAELKKQEEAKKQEEVKKKYEVIAKLKQDLNFTSDQELINFIRGKTSNSAKGKRLNRETNDLIYRALKNGASAPEVAKHFQVSLATVHSKKKKWKLVHRKGVAQRPIQEALRMK